MSSVTYTPFLSLSQGSALVGPPRFCASPPGVASALAALPLSSAAALLLTASPPSCHAHDANGGGLREVPLPELPAGFEPLAASGPPPSPPQCPQPPGVLLLHSRTATLALLLTCSSPPALARGALLPSPLAAFASDGLVYHHGGSLHLCGYRTPTPTRSEPAPKEPRLLAASGDRVYLATADELSSFDASDLSPANSVKLPSPAELDAEGVATPSALHASPAAVFLSLSLRSGGDFDSRARLFGRDLEPGEDLDNLAPCS
ncbi:hypothetical protein TeGR_g13506 [Tetraparma gracilis]|uniref:Uncharacterized protein n=1 Tax=Tetraparma gracilis TaxID=2962635 RepID=A0ABQ6NA57_9STRA|nr:hypothetical protein TeGR_g13506 [Tetraparma gracilis]